jgi:hypothetical protein
MSKHLYFVVPSQGQWIISFQEKHYGPFYMQRDAIRSAVDWAYRDGQEGHEAQVIIQRENGSFRTEWTYGLSHF